MAIIIIAIIFRGMIIIAMIARRAITAITYVVNAILLFILGNWSKIDRQ